MENQKDIKQEIDKKGHQVADSGKQALMGEMRNICNALNAASEKMHEQNDYFSGVVDMAAGKLNSACDFVEKEKPEDVVTAVKDISQKNPYLAVGGMFVAGLALSRFLKADGQTRSFSKEE